MKAAIKSLFQRLGYNLHKIPEKPSSFVYDQDGLRTAHSNAFMDGPDFQRAFARGQQALPKGLSYPIHWRLHIALWAASHASRLGGDFVECGVNYGFVSSAVMDYLDWNSLDSRFFLLDTFAGIADEMLTDEERDAGFSAESKRKIEAGRYTVDFDSVTENFSEWDRVQLIRGMVPATLSQIESDRIAYLHLDMNCSQPEVQTLEALWDRIPVGGLVLMDDYTYWGYDSIRIGADDFATSKGVHICALPTGQGLMIKA